jgi:serine/threonine-protein kinase HipA
VKTRFAERADVWKGTEQVGQLVRTEHGASFTYVAAYVASHTGDPARAVAFSLPVRAAPYEVFGTNLHTYFAGLLPEGLRLRALVRALKTSEDDLFSLLLASGADTVGDVAIASPGSAPREQAPVADTAKLSDVVFRELLDESLRYDADGGDVAIAGVQPKVSAAMISFPVRALHKKRAHILKLSPVEFPRLVENEHFFMRVAKSLGISVADTRVVHDKTGEAGLLVDRFDRVPDASGTLRKLHQEDACQLLDRYPADKYRLNLSDVSRALEVCSAPLAERLKLLRLQALSYLIANGDMHAKNVSVHAVSGRIALTPAYDLLSTLPYGDQTLALAMEGRDDKLRAHHFVDFGERVGVRRAATERMLRTICNGLTPWLAKLSEIGLDARRTAHMQRVMTQRIEALRPVTLV